MSTIVMFQRSNPLVGFPLTQFLAEAPCSIDGIRAIAILGDGEKVSIQDAKFHYAKRGESCEIWGDHEDFGNMDKPYGDVIGRITYKDLNALLDKHGGIAGLEVHDID